MAKDDYDVLVCKILVFLYKRRKNLERKSVIDYLVAPSKEFPIEQDYLDYVIENMINEGFVNGVRVVPVWGGKIITGLDQMQITPKGIHYMQENKTMHRIMEHLPEAASIFSLISEFI